MTFSSPGSSRAETDTNQPVSLKSSATTAIPAALTPPVSSTTPAPGPPQVLIGDWILKEDLGSGAFGKVKKAVHRVTGQEAAIKIIRLARVLNLYKKPDVAKRKLEREISILKLLDHPNIVKLYDAIEGDDEIYLVMELVTGGQLSSYLLKKRRLSEEEARKYFRQIVSAIEYCHGNLITHRDLKLENILLDQDGNAKVADFGFSNMIQPGQLFNTFCGSPLYVPPELILQQAYHGPPVDIWALGVLLFTMVGGYLPFWESKANMQALLRKVLAGKFVLPKHITPECGNLIQRILEGDPKRRITIDEIREHPWVLEGYGCPPETFLPPTPPVEEKDLDEGVLSQLESLGFRIEDAREKVLANTHSQATYVYHLLLERNRRREALGLSDEQPISDSPVQSVPLTPSMRSNSFPVAERKPPGSPLIRTPTPTIIVTPTTERAATTTAPEAASQPAPVNSRLAAALQGVFSLSAKLRRLVSRPEELAADEKQQKSESVR